MVFLQLRVDFDLKLSFHNSRIVSKFLSLKEGTEHVFCLQLFAKVHLKKSYLKSYHVL